MANLVYFAQIGNFSLSEKDDYAMARISMIGAGLSSVGCCLNLFLILTVRRPFRTNGNFIVGSHSVTLLFSQMSLIGVENSYESSEKIYCKCITVFVHYVYLSIQFWGMCFGISMLTQMHPSNKLSKFMRKFQYAFIGWCIPLIIVGLTAVARWDSFGYGKWCWLPSAHFTNLAFILPLIFTLVINTLPIISMISGLYRKKKLSISASSGEWTMVLTALPLLGFPWLLGLVPANGDDITLVFNYMFLVLATPQGIFLLLFQLRGTVAVWNAQSDAATGARETNCSTDEKTINVKSRTTSFESA